LSDSRKKEIADVRTAEGAEACRLLGVKRHWFLDGVDGDVAHSARVAPALATLLQQTKYGRIFCPWAKDNHGDHQATFQWLKHVLGQTHYDCDVWLYEVWRPLHPTLVLPLGNSMDAKIAAIHAHASQLKVMNYLEGFCGLAAYRGLTSPPARFAEAFIVATSDAIVAGQHG
ncbi:MAG: PIG-L family deacetylase, partial [Planctomycetaceae bacterium]|nr:PIG-L family deacetylase [Planctomycetaceae bacterium]